VISKSEKAAYDRLYRAKNRNRLKAEKAAYFQRTYDPRLAALKRKKNMPKHNEYCRQPAYKAYKSRYDERRKLAEYGDYAECYQLMRVLRNAINAKQPDRFERYKESGRKQWSYQTQQRRRTRED
jgi:hypothetical protein